MESVWEKITKNIGEQIKHSGKPKTLIAKEVGISKSALSEYLAGRAFPAYDTLKKLCKVLDCTYEDILD